MGLLSTICRPLSLTYEPYSFTRTKWTFPCNKLSACRPPSPQADLFYCTRFERESFYVTSGTLHIANARCHFRAGGPFPITCGYIQDACRPILFIAGTSADLFIVCIDNCFLLLADLCQLKLKLHIYILGAIVWATSSTPSS